MQIVILMAFMAALTLRGQTGWDAPPTVVLLSVLAYVAVAAGLAAMATTVGFRAMARLPGSAGPALRRHNILTFAVQAYLLGGLVALILAGLGNYVEHAPWARRIPLLSEALLLAPFVAALLLTWRMEYPFHRAVRLRVREAQAPSGRDLPIWSLREFISYNLRHNFLFIAVPVGLILLLQDSLAMYGWPAMAGAINDCLVRHHVRELGDSALDALQGGIMVVLAAGVFLAAPVLVVHIWRTRPLPPGPLRQELQADLARLKLRCREILLWQSGGVIANAGVMGLVGPLRYVLLSDALLENLPHRHLQAVFAHEAGHIVSHHIFYAALFAMSTMILAGTAWGAMQAIGINPVVSQVAALVVLGLAWWLFFGRLSRTFERQSDVIGAWTVGLPYNTTGDPDRIVPEGAAIFAQALQQVAQLNGIPSSGPNWRHGSIESRVSYLFWLGSTGSTRRDIDRKVRWIKGGLWALLAVSLAVAAVQERLTG